MSKGKSELEAKRGMLESASRAFASPTSAMASAAAARGAGKVSAMGRRVRRMFNIALNPPPQSDPDPGNPVPFIIRKDINKYRAGFILGLIGLVLLTITMPRTYLYDPISQKLRPQHLTTGIIFGILVLISHYLVTGSDPGYLDIDIALQIGQDHAQHEAVEMSQLMTRKGLGEKTRSGNLQRPEPVVLSSPVSSRISKTKSTARVKPMTQATAKSSDDRKYLDTDDEDVSDGHDDMDDIESSHLMRKGVRGMSSDIEYDEEIDEEPNEALDQSLSGIQQLPIRAKYCRVSKRVVATYDHHCRFLNTTVGERNRARFWFLLLWSTCGICWLLSVVHSGFGNSPPNVGAWMERNGHALAAAIVCWSLFAVCGGLFVFHTFLMLANVTTYEFMRADKVSYLADTKDFDLPFSMGLYENVRFYFLSDSSVLNLVNFLAGRRIEWRPHLWSRPVPKSYDRESTDVCKNLWENKYWSCC